MDTIWIYALVSIAAISGMSLLGLFTLSMANANLQRFTTPMVSVAVGVMLGNAFLHMIPEAFEELRQRHHRSSAHHRRNLSVLHHRARAALQTRMRETARSTPPRRDEFDGRHAGKLHRRRGRAGAAIWSVPQQASQRQLRCLFTRFRPNLSDYSVLVHSGFTRKRALLLNMASSVTAFIGVLLALSIGGSVSNFAAYVLPVAAGCFIYLAAGGLIPRFLQNHSLKASYKHIALMSIGVAAMLALKLME